MKLPEAKIEMAAAKDGNRYALCGVHVDVEAGRLVATDGHILAEHMYTPENGETSGIIPLEVIKAARVGGQNASMEIERYTNEGGVECAQAVNTRQHTSVSVAMIDGKFPDYKRVIPEKPAGPPTVVFNAHTLARLQDALTANKYIGVRLWVTGPSDAIYVEAVDHAETGAVGVLMPIREKN